MKLNDTSRVGLAVAVLSFGAASLTSLQAAPVQPVMAKADIVLVDPHDRHAVRNINNVLTLYQMISTRTRRWKAQQVSHARLRPTQSADC